MVWMLVLWGCGEESATGPDAGSVGDESDALGPLCDCNPVVGQSCCADGEKCAPGHQDPNLDPPSMCVSDGNVPTGGVCTVSPVVVGEAYDDCVVGNVCVDGACREICSQAPDSCDADKVCVRVSGLFEGFDGTGTCVPTCDVIDQDCEQSPEHAFGTGCYLSLTTGEGQCLQSVPEQANPLPGLQGDDCQYLNTCTVGYGCTLLNQPQAPTGNVCAYFCDAENGGGPTCADGPGPLLTCVAINGGFYSDATEVPTEVGFCVDCTVWSDVPGCQ
jgi:hypothetical protein